MLMPLLRICSSRSALLLCSKQLGPRCFEVSMEADPSSSTGDQAECDTVCSFQRNLRYSLAVRDSAAPMQDSRVSSWVGFVIALATHMYDVAPGFHSSSNKHALQKHMLYLVCIGLWGIACASVAGVMSCLSSATYIATITADRFNLTQSDNVVGAAAVAVPSPLCTVCAYMPVHDVMSHL